MTSPYRRRFSREVLEKDLPFFRKSLGRKAFSLFRKNLLHSLDRIASDPLRYGKEIRYDLAGLFVTKFFIGPKMRRQAPGGRIIYSVVKSLRDVLVEVIWFRPTLASEDVSQLILALEQTPDSPYYIAKRRRRSDAVK